MLLFSNAPLQFMQAWSTLAHSSSLWLTLALPDTLWLSLVSLAHSGSLSGSLFHYRSFQLTLTQSDSLWLSQALIGSQGPCSARNVGAPLPQLISPCTLVVLMSFFLPVNILFRYFLIRIGKVLFHLDKTYKKNQSLNLISRLTLKLACPT